jgi:peptide/nickel transport system substrate-binding protein
MRTRNRKPISALHLPTLATLALLAACSGDDAGRSAETLQIEEEGRYGGTAVVALIADPQSMNSLTTNETYARMVQRQVLFTTLFRYDEALQPVPFLAESWDTVRIAPDSLQLTVRLRRDVRWHDGAPTTARDVLFTYARVRDPDVGSSLAASFARYNREVEELDPYTLRFRLRAHADFIDGWAQLAIMPAHILGEVASAALAQHPFGSSEPVGNGPFRFVRRNPGREWVFEANHDFPEALGGRPYLDRLVFRAIPEQTTILTEVLTGGVDVYLRPRASQLPQLQSAAHVELHAEPGSDWVFLAWNNRLPFFDSPDERRALTMGIDRRAIVQAVLEGAGVSGSSPVTPAHWAFTDGSSDANLRYDPDGARRLLARAGWRDHDGDGILQDASGAPFSFTILVPQGNDTGRDAAQIIQSQLARIGVDARPSSVEGNTLIGSLMGSLDSGGIRQRSFDAAIMGWTDGLVKDDSNLFHSRNLNSPFQISGFMNDRVDLLLDTLQLVVDREQARPLWLEYQALMAREVPTTVLFYPNRLTAVNRRLRGVQVDERDELHTVTRWWLDPGRGP